MSASTPPDEKGVLDRLRAILANTPSPSVEITYEDARYLLALADRLTAQPELTVDPDYEARTGYDDEFLGVSLPLPSLSDTQRSDTVTFQNDGPVHEVLPYHHFSIAMSRSRRLAWFTAVNIDGLHRYQIDRTADRWVFDPRIDQETQLGPDLYQHNDLDRGHLVRRQDPDWGTDLNEAQVANDDTFHFTNCSPQHRDFNQNSQTWHGLEDYILNNAAKETLRVSVFSGPVLADDDLVYRDVKIPRNFWKVIVTVGGGGLNATGYLLSQEDLILTLEETFEYGAFRTFQVPISRIEALTSLSFGLGEYDPLASAEETMAEGGIELESLDHIVLRPTL